jgi:hypothetical protein
VRDGRWWRTDIGPRRRLARRRRHRTAADHRPAGPGPEALAVQPLSGSLFGVRLPRALGVAHALFDDQ